MLTISSRQLQAKFKHAADFGVLGPYSAVTAAAFERAIRAHVMSPATRGIRGTYRGKPVVHYLDPGSRLNVIADLSDTYISGWRLNPAQLANVEERGAL